MLLESFITEGFDAAAVDPENEKLAAAIETRYLALNPPNPEQEEALPSVTEQWAALVDSMEVPDSALREMGTSRAAAAKKELVTIGGIDAARIAIAYDQELGVSGVKMIADI